MSTYICEDCGGEFEHGWSYEEALREAIENGFGDIPLEDLTLICDNCYNDIMGNK